MKGIMSIKDLGVNDIPIAGGKAANLGELTAAGFDVPPGFVLTTESYDAFVEHNKLKNVISESIKDIDADSDAALQEASAKIRKAFEEGEIPKELESQIVSEYKKLGKGKYR